MTMMVTPLGTSRLAFFFAQHLLFLLLLLLRGLMRALAPPRATPAASQRAGEGAACWCWCWCCVCSSISRPFQHSPMLFLARCRALARICLTFLTRLFKSSWFDCVFLRPRENKRKKKERM
jgi:hypothetical protein